MALTKDTAGGVTPAPNANTALFETDNLEPAKEMAASGALIEPTIVDRVDTAHPAVDNNPRAGQCVGANRLDLNDPSIPGHAAVARKLGMNDAADPAPTEAVPAIKAEPSPAPPAPPVAATSPPPPPPLPAPATFGTTA